SLASELPTHLRLTIEARSFEAWGNWPAAAERWAALLTFYPDHNEYALALAKDRGRGANARDGLAVIDRIRARPDADRSEPRLSLVESVIAFKAGETERARRAGQRAAEIAAQRRNLTAAAEADLV